jgi:hypothetical protein
MTGEDERIVALERAISTADNAVQAVACLWEMLTPHRAGHLAGVLLKVKG